MKSTVHEHATQGKAALNTDAARREGVRKLLEQMHADMLRRRDVALRLPAVRVQVALELSQHDVRALCGRLGRQTITRLALRAWGRATLRNALDDLRGAA